MFLQSAQLGRRLCAKASDGESVTHCVAGILPTPGCGYVKVIGFKVQKSKQQTKTIFL